MSEVIEEFIELEGVQTLLLKRGDPPEYSFDAGVTWHPAMAEAYLRAQSDGTICRKLPKPPPPDEDIQAFIVALLGELQRLQPGEQLKVGRYQERYVVSREETVLVTRASTVMDIEFRMEGESGPREG